MFEKLSFIEGRYDELSAQISDPQVISDQDKFRKLCKEQSDITPIVEKYREYKKLMQNLEDSEAMLSEGGLDKELREMAEEEIADCKKSLERINDELKILLLPKDPNDDKNVIVEIRGGAGGDEAALFAGDLFRMYSMYAESKRWKVDVMNSNATELGGFKEVSFSIEGQGAYSRLKFESGVHRVQRIPSTESGGRIHTSTVTLQCLEPLSINE